MNPVQVEEELVRLMQRLEEAAMAYGEMAEAAGRAEVAHKVAYAKAFASTEGPMAIREQIAVIATEDALITRRVAEARVDAMRQMLATYRGQIDAVRSIGASLRVVSA